MSTTIKTKNVNPDGTNETIEVSITYRDGKLVYPVTDKFIVEWEEMKKVYKKAINLGSIF